MNAFFKALVGIVVVAVLAGAGIYYQYKAAPAEAVGFSREELNLFVEKNVGARDRAQLANDPQRRKDLVKKLRDQLALVAEANRLGLGSTDDARALDEVTTAQVLQAAYGEAHPELAKSMGPHGGGGLQPAQEEVDAWVKAHGDDVARYTAAMASVSKGMQPPMKPENFASAFIFADKARAEGIDQKPDTRLQLKLARYSILFQQMETKLEDDAKMTDDDVKKFYDENKANGQLDQVHVQHILFATVPIPSPTDPTGGKPDPAAKKKLAEEVLERVKKGEDFGELAKQYSDDPGSKDKGGDLDWSPRYKFVPQFEDAAWKLQPGEVSDVVESDFGYHIIKMIERKAPEDLTPQSTEELKDSLTQRKIEAESKDIAKRASVSLPDDFDVTPPSPAEMQPQLPPGMGPMPTAPGGDDEDMGGDEDMGPPAPGEPQPGAKNDATKKPVGAKPASKAPPAPAKKGTK